MAADDATASAYDDPMSERQLGIAADVLRSFGSAFGGQHLAIVGGAVPSLLIARARHTSSCALHEADSRVSVHAIGMSPVAWWGLGPLRHPRRRNRRAV